VLLFLLASTVSMARDETAEQEARRVVEEYLAAWNARDIEAFRSTLNYPHVRLGGDGSLDVSQTRAEYGRRIDFATIARETGWDHTTWDSVDIVHSAAEKVHVAIRATRRRADGSAIVTFDTLYVVTHQNGHWGIQLRSSFLERPSTQ
jgi:hypothetical protein